MEMRTPAYSEAEIPWNMELSSTWHTAGALIHGDQDCRETNFPGGEWWLCLRPYTAFQYHPEDKVLERLGKEPGVEDRCWRVPFHTLPTKAVSGLEHFSKEASVEGLPKGDPQSGQGTTPGRQLPRSAHHGGSLRGCGVPGSRQQGHTPLSGHNRSSCCSLPGCGAAG